MPMVMVRYLPQVSPGFTADLEQLRRHLPEIVAKALIGNEEAAQLTSNEIEIVFETIRPGLDVTDFTLQITIVANDYPSRRANLDERRATIIAALERLVWDAAQKVFVWVWLVPASFGTTTFHPSLCGVTANPSQIADAIELRRRVFIDELKASPTNGITDQLDMFADHIVMVEDTTVIAALRFYRYSDQPRGLAKIGWVVVAPFRRKRGIGRRLMKFTLEHARTRGFEEIILHARIETQGFYEQLGFKISSDEFLEDGSPHVVMGRAI